METFLIESRIAAIAIAQETAFEKSRPFVGDIESNARRKTDLKTG